MRGRIFGLEPGFQIKFPGRDSVLTVSHDGEALPDFQRLPLAGAVVNGSKTPVAGSKSEEGFEARHWYAAYTHAQHESAASQQMGSRGLEVFLPSIERERRWKDRFVRLSTPLFPGYVFVRMQLCDRLRVLSVPSVARLVTFNGRPAAIPDSEIESVRRCLISGFGVQSRPFLDIGTRVRIRGGTLKGVEGIVSRSLDGYKLLVSIELVRQSIALDVDPDNLELVAVENAPARSHPQSGTTL